VNTERERGLNVTKIMSSFVGRLILKNGEPSPLVSSHLKLTGILAVLLAPFAFIPMVGIVVSAWIKALAISQYLHKPYFAAKKMTPDQVAVFVEERKWEYRGPFFFHFGLSRVRRERADGL
jgi:hypothetical protein